MKVYCFKSETLYTQRMWFCEKNIYVLINLLPKENTPKTINQGIYDFPDFYRKYR